MKTKSILAAIACLALVACSTPWIDTVSKSRLATSKLGYRTVAEFNGYYSGQTNKLHGTTPDLEAARSLIYDTSKSLSVSLLTLESVENFYRLAPTNQSPVVNALQAVAANASNIVNTVNYLTK